MAKPNLTPLGTPVADLHPIGEAADVTALEALPIGSRVAGIHSKDRDRCDILEKDDDGTWDRETVAPKVSSSEFIVFPVPILRIGTETAAALAGGETVPETKVDGAEPSEPRETPALAESIAMAFHDTHQALAADFGIRTGGLVWTALPATRKAHLVATIDALIAGGIIK